MKIFLNIYSANFEQYDYDNFFNVYSTGGEYCAGTGLSTPTGNCDASYYCTDSSPTASPAPYSAYGSHCEAGYYCPTGSSYPHPCLPGHYCALDYLNDTSGYCDPGYYCHSLATVPNPTDGNITGMFIITYSFIP